MAAISERLDALTEAVGDLEAATKANAVRIDKIVAKDADSEKDSNSSAIPKPFSIRLIGGGRKVYLPQGCVTVVDTEPSFDSGQGRIFYACRELSFNEGTGWVNCPAGNMVYANIYRAKNSYSAQLAGAKDTAALASFKIAGFTEGAIAQYAFGSIVLCVGSRGLRKPTPFEVYVNSTEGEMPDTSLPVTFRAYLPDNSVMLDGEPVAVAGRTPDSPWMELGELSQAEGIWWCAVLPDLETGELYAVLYKSIDGSDLPEEAEAKFPAFSITADGVQQYAFGTETVSRRLVGMAEEAPPFSVVSYLIMDESDSDSSDSYSDDGIGNEPLAAAGDGVDAEGSDSDSDTPVDRIGYRVRVPDDATVRINATSYNVAGAKDGWFDLGVITRNTVVWCSLVNGYAVITKDSPYPGALSFRVADIIV